MSIQKTQPISSLSLNDFIAHMADQEPRAYAGQAHLDAMGNSSVFSGDEILKSLLKDYSQAQSDLERIIAEHGEDSPMAELACEMRDAVRASVETRLAELRVAYPDLLSNAEYDKDPNFQRQALESALTLRERQAREIREQKELAEQQAQENSDIANDTLVAFFVLSYFSKGYQRSGQLAPYIDMSLNFKSAAELLRED